MRLGRRIFVLSGWFALSSMRSSVSVRVAPALKHRLVELFKRNSMIMSEQQVHTSLHPFIIIVRRSKDIYYLHIYSFRWLIYVYMHHHPLY